MNKEAKQFLDLGRRVVLVTAEDNPEGLFFQEFSQSGNVVGWQKKGNKRLYDGPMEPVEPRSQWIGIVATTGREPAGYKRLAGDYTTLLDGTPTPETIKWFSL